MKVVGIVVDVDGKYFVKDREGNVRRVKVGDKIYEGEELYGSQNHDRIVIESSTSNEKIILFGFDEYVAEEFGSSLDTSSAPMPSETTLDENTPQTHTPKSTTSTTPTQDEAVGFQELFLARSGAIINVEASLIDAANYGKDFEERKNDTQNKVLPFNPLPTLITGLSEVQDNFYDIHLSSGTNTASDSFTFEALSGFKTLSVGTQKFTLSEIESFNNSPVSLSMKAGVLTLDGYVKIDNDYKISYTYITNGAYKHTSSSDIFTDTLPVVVTDVGGQTATASLSINIIDDQPTTQDDTNSIEEGQVVNYVKGDVTQNLDHTNAFGSFGDKIDYVGADSKYLPIVAVDGGIIGSKFSTLYGELYLKADGSYTYILDNTNLTVRALVDGDTLNEVFTYYIEDGDGDRLSATLNIQIEGSSSTPNILALDGNVDEAALAIGTDPSSSSEIFNGKITGTANDGFKEITFTASNGSQITITNLSGIDGSQSINTPEGTLTLLSYSETPYSPGSAVKVGIIDYKYELNTPPDNPRISDSFKDIIDVTLTDIHNATGSDDLVITIADDKPIALNDVNAITEDATPNVVSGNVLINDNVGADVNATPVTAQTLRGQYGDFVLNTDGSYTYTLDNDHPAVDALNTGDILTDTLVYTITDSDGDKTTANLDITINGFTDPNLSVADVVVVEDGENAGNLQVTFTVTMDTVSPRDVTFDFTTINGTALDGTEYTHLSGSTTIAAGSTTTSVTVTLGADDYVADSAKTFDLKISNVNTAGHILDAVATATIEDNAKPNTPYSDADTIENSLESVHLKVVAIDGSSANSVTEGAKAFYKVIVVDDNGNPVLDANGNPASGKVNVVLSDGTALAVNQIAGMPGDYDGTSPLLVEVNRVFEVQTTDDWVSDDGETFSVALANDTSYTNADDYENIIHDTTPVVTTIIDDTDITTLNLSGDASVNEGATATYTLTLDHAPESDLVVTVALLNTTTVDGDFDFSAPETKTQTITILQGQTTATFNIDTFDDAIYENSEEYKVAITNTSGGNFEQLNIGTSEVNTTIVDNEVPPSISIADITILEDGTAIFTVTASGTAKNDITFNFDTFDGTAEAGKDYVAVSGGVGSIVAGQTTTTISVTLSDDYISDNAENFSVVLSNPSTNAVLLTQTTALATIEDDSNNNSYLIDTKENTHEPLTLKLIALDNYARPTLSGDNEVGEGHKALYKVILVDSLGNRAKDDSGYLASGTVDIVINDGTATGGVDYDNILTNVQVNKIFSIQTINDAISDDGETFTLNIKDNQSYSNSLDFERIIHDTSPVTTTINDSGVPKTITFVQLEHDSSVTEADGAVLQHSIVFQELDGTPIALASGNSVTVNLSYGPDTTSLSDFQVKTTQVVITGDGSASYDFTNLVADDFLNEGLESYTLSIDSVVDSNSYFEELDVGADTVTGTITDEATLDKALISITGAQVITEGDNSKEFTLTLDQPATDVTTDILVNLIYSGVAQDGVDYNGVAQVTILAGTNSVNFSLATINDKDIEGSEDFTIMIGAIVDSNFEDIGANPSASSVVNIIIDDVDANPDTNALLEGSNQVTGYLLSNDEVGVNAKVTSFTYKDEAGSIQVGVVGVEADTQYGRITVSDNGSYIYYSDAKENHPSDGDTVSALLPDIIHYTIVDDNGDIDVSKLTVNVGDTIGSIVDSPITSVNEDDLSNGSDTTKESLTAHGDLGIQKGPDDIQSVTFDLTEVQTALGNLQSNGVALNYSLSPDATVLTAQAGTTEVFVVTLNQAGGASSYDLELKSQLDHQNSTGGKLDALDLVIPFRYKEQGTTEDIVKGNLSVTVVDDIPTAVAEADDKTVVEGSATVLSGNVLTNDIQGADGALLLDFKYKDTSGTTQDAYFSTNVTTHTVDTATGSLTVNQDGSWSFTAHSYVDHDDSQQGDTFVGDGSDNDSTQGSFEYRLQDFDTDDSNYVKQIIHVTDGADPQSSGVVNAVDEDDITSSGSDKTQSPLVTGTLDVTGGTDPIDTTFTTTGSNTLTSNGVNITYSLSNSGHTLIGKAGNEVIFEAKITGSATVNNPTYTFELKGALDHPNAAGENTQDIAIEYKALDIDGDRVTSSLVVSVTDDIPTIGTPFNTGEVDEAGLLYGSSTDPLKTKTGGSLDVLTEADSFDTIFDLSTTAALDNLLLDAGSPPDFLIYTISNSGHTLTATAAGKDIFVVNITNPTTTNAAYDFTLINAFNHNGAVDKTLPFNFTTKDYDGDTTTAHFDVKVIDDTGVVSKDINVNEDGTVNFGLTADTISSTSDFITPHGSITFDSATNLFTFRPDTDYSGHDTFDITYTTSTGHTTTTTVNAEVIPISDAPTIDVDTNLTTLEDTLVALHLKAPIVKDNFDQNDVVPNSHDIAGDNPERLGAITLSGIPNGAELHFANTVSVMNGSDITIKISDLDENSDGILDHISGLSADITMTKAEFESMYINPVPQSGDNMHITYKVTSFEVDDSGVKLTTVAGKESTKTFEVDVQAVTDRVAISNNLPATGDEDSWIRIDQSFIITPTVDSDGSEQYELVFDISNLPTGTLYYSGSTPSDMQDPAIGTDVSGGFKVIISDINNIPEIYIMTPTNDSSDIQDMRVTVNVLDTDSDSSGTITPQSASTQIDVVVTPVANDVVVSSTGSSGDEDSLIDLNLKFVNSDGSPDGQEKVIEVIIGDVPDGAIIYDVNGTVIYHNTSGSLGSVTVSTPSGDLTKVEGYKILPPAHSSKDIVLKVSMTLEDYDDGGTSAPDIRPTTVADITVIVNAVTESDTKDSDNDGTDDIVQNPDHIYTTTGYEDTYFSLNTADAGFSLLATNEDDKSINPYGSEETSVVFTNIRSVDSSGVETPMDDTKVKYNDGSKDIIQTLSNTGEVEVPIAYLNTVEIMLAKDYAGTVKVDTFVKSQDFDEDTNNATSIEKSDISTLSIDINPVIDGNPNVNISQSVGTEDDGRISDGKITAASVINGININASISSLDPDGSEKFRVFIDEIPEDAALYYKGHIIYANSGNSFSSDGINVSDNGDGTFKVQLEDYSSTQVPVIIPPHNFDGDIILKISSQTTDTAIMSDGSVVEVVGPISVEKDLHIKVDAVADQVIYTQLKHFDIQEDSTITTGDKFHVIAGINGAYNLVVQEDSSGSGVGAAIAINELFISGNSINSYDNLKSNAIDASPVNDTSVASENVTITIKNLDAQFDISGATLVGGTGSSRIWSTTLADFKAGNVLVTTPKDFSGEVDFDMKFISTESTGNTKEGALEHIKVLVTPVAEDISGLPFESLDINEDVLESTYIGFSAILPDKNGNPETINELWIKVDDVTNKEFKVFYDDGTTKYNEISTVVGMAGISIENIAGVDYYHMQNDTFKDLYIQYDSDRGTSSDILIDVKVTLIDYIDIGGQTIANISSRTDNVYSMNLIAVTDDIEAKILVDTDLTWSDNADFDNPTPKDEIQNIIVDANGDVSLDVMTNTELKLNIDIKGIDTSGEVDINNPSNTTNTPDYDGSEKIVRIRLDGVPQGVDIENGYYAGDVGTPPIYSGIWYVDNPQDVNGGDLIIDGFTTYALQLNINGDNTLGHEVGGRIVVSFENKDGVGAIENNIVTIALDDTNFVPHTIPEVPIDILEWETDSSFQIVEDIEFTLNDIVNFTVKTDIVGDSSDGTFGGIAGASTGDAITSNKFSITVEAIENATVSGAGWNLDSTQSTPFYTFQGQGGQAEIDAALTALKIQPDKDYNENARPSLYTGALEIRTVLTTYGAGGLMDKQGVDYSGDVQPVTDDFDLNPNFIFTDVNGLSVLEAQEDGSVAIKINPTSVDNPYLSVVGLNITVTNSSLPNSEGEAMDGKITYNDGTNLVTVDLKAGDSVSIPSGQIDTLVFKLYDFRNDIDGNERGNYLAGEVKLEYSLDLQEVGATGVTTHSDAVKFYVNPVADGLDIPNAKLSGLEDTYIELTAQNGDSFDSLGALVDPTETLTSLVIDGVPNGYLVFYGDTHQNSASVIGVSGGLVSFSVPISAGNPPKIWILPPENIGGVSSFSIPGFDLLDSITLKVGVDDMGVTVFNTKPVNITIHAVADSVTINPADSNGVEGSDIKLNFNTTVVDTDSSENLIVTLQGLHQDAVFKLDGVEIDSGFITYDKASDTYTIKNAAIDYTNVSKLTFMQNDFSGTVTTTVVAQEKSNFDIYPTPASATFSVNIAGQDGTSGDDTLLFDKTNGNDGLGGSDTLVFGYDWAQEAIDFTLYSDALTKNIETLDLKEHGNHNLALSATDLVAMTDSNNELLIDANYGDSVALLNDGDNVWAQKGSTNVYEGANGGKLTISGFGINIGDALLNPTTGDDTLGYNDSKLIDAGAGDDRLIIFENHELDFNKVQNVEQIDLSVVGNHTMSNISIADVLGSTDATNHLKFFGDANDSVNFAANENWTKGAQVTEGGKTFDVYTTSNDVSVEVKVEDAINDSI